MTDILANAEPLMNGSVTVTVPAIPDGSPANMQVTIPATLVAVIRRLIAERDALREYAQETDRRLDAAERLVALIHGDRVRVECPRCDGSGQIVVDGKADQCPYCAGGGSVHARYVPLTRPRHRCPSPGPHPSPHDPDCQWADDNREDPDHD